jgi:hypothetical protein
MTTLFKSSKINIITDSFGFFTETQHMFVWESMGAGADIRF